MPRRLSISHKELDISLLRGVQVSVDCPLDIYDFPSCVDVLVKDQEAEVAFELK